jgi:hypothetical protein
MRDRGQDSRAAKIAASRPAEELATTDVINGANLRKFFSADELRVYCHPGVFVFEGINPKGIARYQTIMDAYQLEAYAWCLRFCPDGTKVLAGTLFAPLWHLWDISKVKV